MFILYIYIYIHNVYIYIKGKKIKEKKESVVKQWSIEALGGFHKINCRKKYFLINVVFIFIKN